MILLVSTKNFSDFILELSEEGLKMLIELL
jgi:hypothetical protein